MAHNPLVMISVGICLLLLFLLSISATAPDKEECYKCVQQDNCTFALLPTDTWLLRSIDCYCGDLRDLVNSLSVDDLASYTNEEQCEQAATEDNTTLFNETICIDCVNTIIADGSCSYCAIEKQHWVGGGSFYMGMECQCGSDNQTCSNADSITDEAQCQQGAAYASSLKYKDRRQYEFSETFCNECLEDGCDYCWTVIEWDHGTCQCDIVSSDENKECMYHYQRTSQCEQRPPEPFNEKICNECVEQLDGCSYCETEHSGGLFSANYYQCQCGINDSIEATCVGHVITSKPQCEEGPYRPPLFETSVSGSTFWTRFVIVIALLIAAGVTIIVIALLIAAGVTTCVTWCLLRKLLSYRRTEPNQGSGRSAS